MSILSLALLVASLAPQEAAAERPPFVQEAEPLDRALDALEAAVASRASPAQAFESLDSALAAQAQARPSDDARARAWKERTAATIDELKLRAQAGTLDSVSVARLREDVLDARAERALAWLEDEARSRKPTRAQFERVSAVFQARLARARAEGADDGPRQRWQNLIAEVRARNEAGGTSPADFSLLREELVASRLERALAWLEERALARSASRVDFDRVRAALEDRAAAAGGADDLERLQKALAKLEERAQAGELTREEFQKLAQTLIGKAREAGSALR